jgi:hypothetical protein
MVPATEEKRRRRTAFEVDLGRYLRPGYHGLWWAAAEIALLGRLSNPRSSSENGADG